MKTNKEIIEEYRELYDNLSALGLKETAAEIKMLMFEMLERKDKEHRQQMISLLEEMPHFKEGDWAECSKETFEFLMKQGTWRENQLTKLKDGKQ